MGKVRRVVESRRGEFTYPQTARDPRFWVPVSRPARRRNSQVVRERVVHE